LAFLLGEALWNGSYFNLPPRCAFHSRGFADMLSFPKKWQIFRLGKETRLGQLAGWGQRARLSNSLQGEMKGRVGEERRIINNNNNNNNKIADIIIPALTS
jgi:hypothetical protein